MWQCASISPGMIHLPAASITSTVLRSSICTSGGSAPTLLIRLPSTTMASLRCDGFPEPSISVPLRITRVFLAALMGLLRFTLYNVAPRTRAHSLTLDLGRRAIACVKQSRLPPPERGRSTTEGRRAGVEAKRDSCDPSPARCADPPFQGRDFTCDSRLPPGEGEGRQLPFSRCIGIRVIVQTTGSSSTPRYAKPSQAKARKWSAGRRQGRGPRHADGCCHPLALRARRAPQKISLRKPSASGALRLPALHRDPPPRLSTAVALRTAPAPPDRCQRPASCKEAG